MPTYEYQCSDCDHSWEEDQRITADAIEVCPKCNKNKAKRVISAPSFVLKGGGWASDGYSPKY